MVTTVAIAQQCSVPGCGQPSGPAAERGHMCLTHFIKTCYRELDELNRSTHTWTVGGAAWESARRFLQDCVQISTNFSQQKSNLSNIERAQLVDISIWAGELGQRLRRGPRNPLTITIRLISEMPGHCWQEETYTLDINRLGARANCHHPVKKDDRLKVIRLDTGEQMAARVAWHRQTKSHTHEIGMEFLCGQTT